MALRHWITAHRQHVCTGSWYNRRANQRFSWHSFEESLAIIVRAIEDGWPIALALIVVSGGVLAAHGAGFPEPDLFREWIGLATVSIGCGVGFLFVAVMTWFLQQVRCAFASSRARRELANASKQQTEMTKYRLEIARRNLAMLGPDERSLLADALKLYPYCVEVLELGPAESLVNKDILCIIGEGSSTTLICKVHAWLAAHRNELISTIDTGYVV
jgi:hypothetical protein